MNIMFRQARSTELTEPCSKIHELFIEKHCCRLYLSISNYPYYERESLLWRR